MTRSALMVDLNRVAGVDACRSGWIAVILFDGIVETAVHASNVGMLLATLEDVSTVAIDIPIGIDGSYPRRADLAAKAFVGVRRSSVFLTPPREVLVEAGYEKALLLARESIGVGVSRQAHALGPKILEVDEVSRTDPRIIEVHPELSFRAMAGNALPYSKKSWNGMKLRERLLLEAGIELAPDLPIPGSVAADDVLDAAAAAWSAERYFRGEARSLPEAPEPGEPRIWY